MTTQLQQAITLTQSAVGQLQGMFKRLAGKMEVDVATLKTGLRDVVAVVQTLRNDVNQLRETVIRLQGGPPNLGAHPGGVAPAASRPVAPMQQVTETSQRAWPTAASRQPPTVEDAVFYTGGDDNYDEV